VDAAPSKLKQGMKKEEAEKDESGKAKWVSAPIVYIKHKDYLQGQADRWGSVPWVARRHLFTRDELVSECKMSKADAEKVPLNITLPSSDKKDKPESSKGQEQFKRAECWKSGRNIPRRPASSFASTIAMKCSGTTLIRSI